MARLMLSAGMFSALAAAMAPRRRGLPSGSPPPCLAAMVISVIRRVKILPRLASRAPFLCLIVAHFEWPDIEIPRVHGLYLRRNRPWRRSMDCLRNSCRRTKIIAWGGRGESPKRALVLKAQGPVTHH